MDAIREMYARWAAGDMGEDDQWGDVTAEPRGLDYAEVSATACRRCGSSRTAPARTR